MRAFFLTVLVFFGLVLTCNASEYDLDNILGNKDKVEKGAVSKKMDGFTEEAQKKQDVYDEQNRKTRETIAEALAPATPGGYVSVSADITAGISTCLVEGILLQNLNGDPDSNSPGNISDKDVWSTSKTISKGYSGGLAGRYRYSAKVGNCDIKGRVCSGIINVSGSKSAYKINFYDDCKDAGSSEF